MIAYTRERLLNTFLMDRALELKRTGLVTGGQCDSLGAQLPGLHRSRSFIARAGMFVLGCLLFWSCTAVMILFLPLLGERYHWTFLANAIFGFVVLEVVMVRKKGYFAQGLDDAFVFCSLVSGCAFMVSMIPGTHLLWLRLAMGAIIALVCCVRYADSLAAIVCCVLILTCAGERHYNASVLPKQYLPITLIASVLLLLVLLRSIDRKKSINEIYHGPIHVAMICCGFLLYASGNLFLVRQLGEQGAIMTWFFYCFTVICPAAFIVVALKKHHRALLWLGFITATCSVLTIRHYHPVLPVEWALMIAGGFLFGAGAIARNTLRRRTTGLTFTRSSHGEDDVLIAAETISIAAQVASYQGGGQENGGSGSEIGGGEFGGGGSGQKY